GQGKRCAPIEEDDGWLQGGKRRRKGGLLLRGPCGFGELDLDESAAIWCAAVPTAPIVEGAEGEAALAAEGGDGSTAVDLGLMESCECLGVHGASVWGGGRSSNLAGGSCRDGVHRGFTLNQVFDVIEISRDRAFQAPNVLFRQIILGHCHVRF